MIRIEEKINTLANALTALRKAHEVLQRPKSSEAMDHAIQMLDALLDEYVAHLRVERGQ